MRRDGVLGGFADLMAGLALGEDLFARRGIASGESRPAEAAKATLAANVSREIVFILVPFLIAALLRARLLLAIDARPKV